MKREMCPECWRLYDELCKAREQRISAEQLALNHGSTHLINTYRAADQAYTTALELFQAHRANVCAKVTA